MGLEPPENDLEQDTKAVLLQAKHWDAFYKLHNVSVTYLKKLLVIRKKSVDKNHFGYIEPLVVIYFIIYCIREKQNVIGIPDNKDHIYVKCSKKTSGRIKGYKYILYNECLER